MGKEKTNFTLGPWKPKLELDELGDYFQVLDADGRPVCNFTESSQETLQDINNAVAIACLPDLWNALHEAAYEMCMMLGDDHCLYFDREKETCSDEDGRCFVQRWWNLLRKANGETDAQDIEKRR